MYSLWFAHTPMTLQTVFEHVECVMDKLCNILTKTSSQVGSHYTIWPNILNDAIVCVALTRDNWTIKAELQRFTSQ